MTISISREVQKDMEWTNGQMFSCQNKKEERDRICKNLKNITKPYKLRFMSLNAKPTDSRTKQCIEKMRICHRNLYWKISAVYL